MSPGGTLPTNRDKCPQRPRSLPEPPLRSPAQRVPLHRLSPSDCALLQGTWGSVCTQPGCHSPDCDWGLGWRLARLQTSHSLGHSPPTNSRPGPQRSLIPPQNDQKAIKKTRSLQTLGLNGHRPGGFQGWAGRCERTWTISWATKLSGLRGWSGHVRGRARQKGHHQKEGNAGGQHGWALRAAC